MLVNIDYAGQFFAGQNSAALDIPFYE